MPLAKINGNRAYIALMEDVISKPTAPHFFSYAGSIGRLLGLFQALKRNLGLAPAETSPVAEMVAALKAASETALQIQIEEVAVTAPWMAAWDSQRVSDNVVNKALLLANLRPWARWTDAVNYIGELNAVSVNEERWVCPESWCIMHGVDIEEETQGGTVFFIRLVVYSCTYKQHMAKIIFLHRGSFTNQSLYTSFQRATCYFFKSTSDHLAAINSRYGLNRESEAISSAVFWNEFKAHLLSLVKQHAAWGREFQDHLPFTILVVGEAADTPEFLDVVHDVVEAIPELCTIKPGDVELVIPADRTYGAAKGAAFWRWTMLDKKYCVDAGFPDQYDMIQDAHVEL